MRINNKIQFWRFFGANIRLASLLFIITDYRKREYIIESGAMIREKVTRGGSKLRAYLHSHTYRLATHRRI